jgi:CdiI immunity protein
MSMNGNRLGKRFFSSSVIDINSIAKVGATEASSSTPTTNSANLLDQISESNYPHLFQFFSGYFGEDWRDDVISVVEDMEGTTEPDEYIFRRVVAKYIAQALPVNVVRTTTELEKLLALPLNNDQLQTGLSRNLRCYFVPGDAKTYRPWLTAIRNQLCIVRQHHVR